MSAAQPLSSAHQHLALRLVGLVQPGSGLGLCFDRPAPGPQQAPVLSTEGPGAGACVSVSPFVC